MSGYSPTVKKILEKNNIKTGSKVKISKGKQTYTGILMPRTHGDENVLLIKLNNGYNIGLNFDKNVKIKKVSDPVELGKIPVRALKHKKDLPSVAIIATGGTIGTHVDYKTGGVFMCRTPEEIIATTPELEDIVNIKEVKSPFTIASEDLSYKHWQIMAKGIAESLNNGYEGAIVTIGTDTLHYTSAAMSFMLKDLKKPVALVGAQRSPDRGSFDGVLNLICAAHFTGHSDIGEVCSVMHGSINDDYCLAIRGTKVRKMHTSRRDAFRPINNLPIAKIFRNGKMEIIDGNYVKRDNNAKVESDVAFEEKVALVKVYPNPTPEILEWYADKGFKGVVLEGTGLGHVPTGMSGKEVDKKTRSWIPVIKKVVDRGLLVFMTSQCLYGRVNAYVYRNLRLAAEAGVVYLEGMLPEVAFVKLGWVLGHTKKAEEVKKKMLENVAGEMTKRDSSKMFLY